MEMAMKIRRRGRRLPTKTLQAVAWPGADTLERIRHLNEESLRAVAMSTSSAQEASSVKVVSRNRDLWLRMDVQACKRAAHIPVLLVDLNFEDSEWWQRIVYPDQRPVKTTETTGLVSIKNGTSLLREILVEACVIVRSHPRAARLVFGMSAGVVATITDLQASQIESVAVTYSSQMKLRWTDNLIFWKNLLSAAVEGADDDLAAVRLHSLQLLGYGG
jgi:hypothetical protein